MEEMKIFDGPIFVQIREVDPDDYLEPKKSPGIYELTGHVMNDFEKKIFTVFQRIISEMEQLRKDIIESKIAKNDVGKTEAKIRELLDKKRHVKGLLYFSISDRLNMWGTNLGVTSGWKIIIPDDEAQREEIIATIEIPKELRHLFEKIEKAIREGLQEFKTGDVAMHCPGNDTVH